MSTRRFSTTAVMICCLVLLAASAGSASAATLKVGTYYQFADWGTGESLSYGPEFYSATGPLVASTGFVSWHGASVQVKARADYGSLGVYAFASPAGNTSVSGSASSEFTDTWTISSPGLEGTPGLLDFWVDVSGTVTGPFHHPGVSPGVYWLIGFKDNYYSAIESWDYSTNSGREAYHGFLRQSLNFTYGTPFQFTISFSASPGGYGASSADYYNTATLDIGSSIVRDSSGNPVTGYSLITQSGSDYSHPVPEPSLALALGLGLAGMVSFGSRRKR